MKKLSIQFTACTKVIYIFGLPTIYSWKTDSHLHTDDRQPLGSKAYSTRLIAQVG